MNSFFINSLKVIAIASLLGCFIAVIYKLLFPINQEDYDHYGYYQFNDSIAHRIIISPKYSEASIIFEYFDEQIKGDKYAKLKFSGTFSDFKANIPIQILDTMDQNILKVKVLYYNQYQDSYETHKGYLPKVLVHKHPFNEVN